MKFSKWALLLLFVCQTSHAESVLWYRKPADPKKWEQALPLGNGRLGAMVFGGIDRERIIYNEDSIWSGWYEPGNDPANGPEALARLRKLIAEKADRKQINDVALKEFCSKHGYGKNDFGAYQSFCDAILTFKHDPAAATNYRRDLDLRTAVSSVSYELDGTSCKREVFSSHPDQVVVIRLTADNPKSVSFDLGAASLHKLVKISAKGNELFLDGRVDTGSPDHPGLEFQARWRVVTEGGSVTPSDDGLRLVVREADAVTVLTAGATDYRLSYPEYRGDPPGPKNERKLSSASGKAYEELRERHVSDHRSLYDRVQLSLGGAAQVELPTDERLASYKKSRDDRGLEALVFQYGRYLMIASSRPGGLPANLQGLWNNSNTPPWNGDYHLNINLQMNYWPVNSSNLDECADPLIRWTEDLAKAGAKTARVQYGTRGWAAHHTCNVWGFASAGPARGVHMLEAESAAFLCRNIWDHYAYTRDRDYLEKSAWPLLKGAAEFWVDNLQEVDGGFLAVSPSYSPEHGPLTDGTYYQTMIVHDLFSNCIEAARILDRNHDFAKQLAGLRDRLQPPRVGEYGQLQEWRDPALEKNANKDKHRHISHMFAVYPGEQIVYGRDPDLMKAAIQTMNFRGDGATGWSMGWKINLWARFRDGDRAHKLIGNLVGGKLYPNLWDAHPPFQIDGNFGYTAGVAEMLVQSHAEQIVLLPALPKAWSEGSVKGLCARGGFELDQEWKQGELTSVRVTSKAGGPGKLVYGDKIFALEMKKGESETFKAGVDWWR